MNWTDRRTRFRAILEGTHCVKPACVFDPISIRIAEELGYEVGMFSGSVASLVVLGAPDWALLTLSELAEQARRINRAAKLPVLVDGDHGYGNALNVMRAVAELEIAGAAALTIEDTDLPPRFGAGGRNRLLTVEEGVGKMRAALRSRGDKSLCIVGRTSATDTSGLQETIDRAKAYGETGVDAIFITGLKSRGDLDEISAAVRQPLILGPSPALITDIEFLSTRGVRIALEGVRPFLSSISAVYQTMQSLRSDASAPPAILESNVIDSLTHLDEYKRFRTEFLGD